MNNYVNLKNTLIVLLLVSSELLFIMIKSGSVTDARYFLSATSQALAALFALIFTITLVISQLASTHSNRLLGYIFDKKTMIYMGLFSIAVIIPLIGLKNLYYKEFFVLISGSLAIFCIVYLIPFLLSLKERLKVDSLIKSLANTCSIAITKNLKGEYEEYHLSEEEKERYWEEITIIDNIALSGWNRKDYDTFQTSIQSLLSTVKNIKNWPTIEQIRIRIEEIGRIVIKDPRATNIILDSLKDIFPFLEGNDKDYPIKELLCDYHDFSFFIISDGLNVSILHSIANYREIGMTLIEKNKEDLLLNMLDDFISINKRARHRDLQKRSPSLMTFATFGVAAAKSGLKNATINFLKYLIKYDFRELLHPPFKTIDIVKEESEKRNWDNIYSFCKELEKPHHRVTREGTRMRDILHLLDE